jgi:hypothetical protein
MTLRGDPRIRSSFSVHESRPSKGSTHDCGSTAFGFRHRADRLAQSLDNRDDPLHGTLGERVRTEERQ